MATAPAVGQQRGELLVGQAADGKSAESVAQVRERIDAVPLAARREAEQHRRRLTALVTAGEQEVLPSNGHALHFTLGRVVVDTQEPFLRVTRQRFPVPQGVVAGYADRTFWQYVRLTLLLLEPGV